MVMSRRVPALGHVKTLECTVHELLQAATDGDDAAVQELLDGRAVGPGSQQWTPRALAPNMRNFWPSWTAQAECQALHCAAAAGRAEVCRLLLAANATPAACTRHGVTGPMLAAFGAHTDCVRLMLHHAEGRQPGANELANCASRDGFTALHLACCAADHVEAAAVVALLLEAGADLHCKDRADRTPLHYAAANHNASACGALIRAGAWLQVADAGGTTPLSLARVSDGQTRLTAARPHSDPATARDDTLRALCWLPSVRLLWVGHSTSPGAVDVEWSDPPCLLRMLTRDVVRMLCSAVIVAHEDGPHGDAAPRTSHARGGAEHDGRHPVDELCEGLTSSIGLQPGSQASDGLADGAPSQLP